MGDMEIRSGAGEIRAVSDADKTFELRIVAYGVVDSYGSVWDPGVFGDSLRTKLPPACWAHDWARVIGSIVEHDDRSDGQYGLVRMADQESVPDARMAYSLIKDGHIKDTSFGFKREEWGDKRSDGWKPGLDGELERMTRARLDEVSPVLVGAVPGARILSVRSEGRISRMDAGQLLTGVATGQITLRDALNALESDEMSLLRGEPNPEPEPEPEELEVNLNEEDVELAFALMALDDGNRVLGEVTNPKGTLQLKEYWAHGKGAAKIRWGTPGDHTRCVEQLRKYVGPEAVHGLCTNIQKMAIGHAGNPTAVEKGL